MAALPRWLVPVMAVAASGALLTASGWNLYRHTLHESAEALASGRAIVIIPGAEPTAPETPPPAAAEPPATPAAEEKQPPPTPPETAPAASPPEEKGAIKPGEGLNVAPFEPLTEKTEDGLLPKIAADGKKAWQYYARPFTPAGDAPRIAVVVTGLGFSKQLAEAALRLPPAVSLSFSPYAPNLGAWISSARAQGHEVLLDLPMETAGYPAVDSGPHALIAAQTPETNAANLRWVLTRTTGYVGVVGAGDERFTQNKEPAQTLFQELGARGLMLALSYPNVPEQTLGLATAARLPLALATAELPEETRPEDFLPRIRVAEETARRDGQALVVTEASPALLKALAEWLENLEKKGLTAAPVSALARAEKS